MCIYAFSVARVIVTIRCFFIKKALMSFKLFFISIIFERLFDLIAVLNTFHYLMNKRIYCFVGKALIF